MVIFDIHIPFIDKYIHYSDSDIFSQLVMIGDGTDEKTDKKPCQRCHGNGDASEGIYRPRDGFSSQLNQIKRHKKRHAASAGEMYAKAPYITPRDGPLDSESYYTAFLDAIGKKWFLLLEYRFYHFLVSKL